MHCLLMNLKYTNTYASKKVLGQVMLISILRIFILHPKGSIPTTGLIISFDSFVKLNINSILWRCYQTERIPRYATSILIF